MFAFFTRIISILLFLLPLQVFSQLIDSFACKIIHAIQLSDSAELVQLPIQPSDTKFIIRETLKRSGQPIEEDTLISSDNPKPDSSWIAATKQIIAGFQILKQKATNMGVDWSTVNCKSSTHENINNPDTDFKTINGIIYLKAEPKKVKLLYGAVKINQVWRITSIDVVYN